MFTTACDAVSTKRCCRSAVASMCRFEWTASQANNPVTAVATNTVASETQATSVRCGCRRGGGAGWLIRILTGVGTSTLTPVTDGAAPAAGPAALDARPRTGFRGGAETV